MYNINYIYIMKMEEEQNLGYNDEDIPETTINDNSTPELLKALINNDSIPTTIKKDHWETFTNDLPLSFQTEQSRKLKLLDFDLMKLDDLMAKPYSDYTFEREALWNKLRLVFETKLDRAVGFKSGGRINERLVQQTQFGEQKLTKTVDSTSAPGGILAGLLGRKKG